MKCRKLRGLCLIAVIVAFAGFLVENIFLAATLGFMDNRNMILPLLLGCGLGVAALYVVFGTPQTLRFFRMPVQIKNPVLRTGLYYLIVCLCVAVGEILLGTFVEETCNITWWDYSVLPLHITKFTSVPTTVAFALLITLFMGLVFTPLYGWLCRKESRFLNFLAWTLMVLMVADFIHSAAVMYKTRDFFEIWRIEF